MDNKLYGHPSFYQDRLELEENSPWELSLPKGECVWTAEELCVDLGFTLLITEGRCWSPDNLTDPEMQPCPERGEGILPTHPLL